MGSGWTSRLLTTRLDPGQGWWVCGVNLGAVRAQSAEAASCPRQTALLFSQELCTKGSC